MAILPVNSWTLWQTASGTSATSASAPTTVAGNTIFVSVSIFTKTTTVTSITDVAGNTYVKDSSGNGAGTGGRIEIWRCSNCLGSAGNAITVHLSASPSGCDMGAVEFSGLTTAGTQDGAGSSTTGNNTTPGGGSFSTTQPNGVASTLLISAFTDAATTNTANPTVPSTPAAYTAIYTFGNASTFVRGGAAYLIVSTTETTINPVWTTSSTQQWVAVNLAYEGAAAPGGSAAPALMLMGAG